MHFSPDISCSRHGRKSREEYFKQCNITSKGESAKTQGKKAQLPSINNITNSLNEETSIVKTVVKEVERKHVAFSNKVLTVEQKRQLQWDKMVTGV